MDSLSKLLIKDLTSRESKGSLRSLKIYDNSLIDFSSNDYLGLARSDELTKEIDLAVASLSLRSNGATGSRLLTGNNNLTQRVEKELAVLFQSEAALLFNSGYTANLAVLSSLPKRGDTILYDELSHASIKDGMKLSLANRKSFRHNDILDLTRQLKRATGNLYVVVESVYSMDGDIAPLKALVELCGEYDAHLIVDEAHSTGIYGKNGNGLCCQLFQEQKIPVRVYTFGKAMGIHGACVAGSRELIDYLINFARPFIYTTAMDQKSVLAISCAFQFLTKEQALPLQLQRNIQHFISTIGETTGFLPSPSAIQSFIISGNERTKAAAEHLQKNGLDVRPILSPTVPEGKERLRIILHAFNSAEDINQLTSELRLLSSSL